MKRPPHHPLNLWLQTPGRRWAESGHPWLYRTHLRESFKPPKGPAALIAQGTVYFYSPKSEIRLRRVDACKLTSSSQEPEWVTTPQEFATRLGPHLVEPLKTLLNFKKRAVDGERCFRWIFAETDGFPGLTVDVFDDTIVAQVQTAPWELFWPAFEPLLLQAFRESTGREGQLRALRNMPVRTKEGLEVIPLEGSVEGRWIPWNGFDWWMSPGGPQKTGAYLDQKENHQAAARWAKRLGLRSAWDLCSFEGGFSLHLARAGLEVTAFDQSATALETLRKNAEKNGLKVATREANVFDFLKETFNEGRRTGVIVLDPPSFVRTRSQREPAMRGLKELNLRSLYALTPGGLLVTCTCSHHIGPQDLNELMLAASIDSGRRIRLLEDRGPAPDHASTPQFPEAKYLQARYYEVT